MPKTKTKVTMTIKGEEIDITEKLDSVEKEISTHSTISLEERIRLSILDDNLEIESVEYNSDKDTIKIKSSYFAMPVSTFVSDNKKVPLDVNFILAIEALKPHINYFKDYYLPNEADLKEEFQREMFLQGFKNLDEDDDELRDLKHSIMSKPSVEKIHIKKFEINEIREGDASIPYYSFKVETINRKTNLPQCDELNICCFGVPEQDPEFQNIKIFLLDIKEFLSQSKLHIKEIEKYNKNEENKKERIYIQEMSQGELFAKLNPLDQLYIERKKLAYHFEDQDKKDNE